MKGLIPSPSDPRSDMLTIYLSVSIMGNFLLLAWLYWSNITYPSGELVNKPEWSVVAAAQHKTPNADSNDIVLLQKPFNQESLDIVGIPSANGHKMIWVLSNTIGLPRLKISPSERPRTITVDEFDMIKAGVRLNEDVTTYLETIISSATSD